MNHGVDDCVVCLGQFSDEQIILKCGHIFCFSCITNWFHSKNSSSCPTCRTIHTGTLFKCHNAIEIKTPILDCLAFFKFQKIPIRQVSNDMSKLGKCYYCSYLYGFEFECINTTTKELTLDNFCSKCSKCVCYDIETNKIIGDGDLFLKQLEFFSKDITEAYRYENDPINTKYVIINGHYDYNYYIMRNPLHYRYEYNTKGAPNFIPSNYDLIGLFYRKSDNELVHIIDNIMKNWNASEGHYMTIPTADRLYNIFRSSLKESSDHDFIINYFLKTIAPFVISYNKSEYFKIWMKHLAPSFDDENKLDIHAYVKYMYCLRNNVFKYAKWYNVEITKNMDFNELISNF